MVDPLETSHMCYLAHARLIFRLRRSDHITDAVSLHWLRVPKRITYGCRLDVPCSDRRRTTVSAAIRPYCRRAFSSQTPFLYFRRPDRSGVPTDLHRLSRVSGSLSLHLKHATTARHLCLIVDCIQTTSYTSSDLFFLPWTFPSMT